MLSRHASRSSATPLASTTLEVNINDLLAEYVLNYRFENSGNDAIEAVFSFPIPLDAAFLGMRATFAGEVLEAQVQSSRRADRTYDDAIADGHSAILLTAPEPGLLCVSLGNLQAGEAGDIELRFVTPLRVADSQARFSLPLVHRPRYGTWSLDDLETPTHDFATAHPMSANIRVTGLLANAAVTCTTHAARFAKCGDALELSIGQAMLDRDLTLGFELTESLQPTIQNISDGAFALGLASLVLPRREGSARPLELCLVLDGSGSMNGDAIAQSRKAVDAIIRELTDLDRIQVLRFGSSVEPMFRRPLLATPIVREAMQKLLPSIQANLGGTEMGDALDRALLELGSGAGAPPHADHTRVIILVTDGAVQRNDIALAQASAVAAGVRIFVVAVGSSAGAEVLESLTEATGAIMERAVPAEPIDAGVMRQFRRARESKPVELQVSWPDMAAVTIPMGVTYPGDAVHVAAVLAPHASGKVVINAPSLDFSVGLTLPTRTEVPVTRAWLGLRRYRSATSAEREALALQYALLTRETSAVLVKERAAHDQAIALPRVVRVPQMLPGGMLSIARHQLYSGSFDSVEEFSPSPMRALRMGPNIRTRRRLVQDSAEISAPSVPSSPLQGDSYEYFDDSMDIVETPITPPTAQSVLRALLDALAAVRAKTVSQPLLLSSAVETLPADVRKAASALLRVSSVLGAYLADDVDATPLLHALQIVLEDHALTDEQEAVLALGVDQISGMQIAKDELTLLQCIEALRALMQAALRR